MRFYSAAKRGDGFLNQHIYKMDTALSDPNAIYFYDRLDAAVRGVRFEDLMSQEHWDHLRDTFGTKILIYFPDDYFNKRDLVAIRNQLKRQKIPVEKVHWIVKDELFRKFVLKCWKDYGEPHIYLYGALQLRVPWVPEEKLIQPSKAQFSCFSRNYHPERLALYLDFYRKDFLSDMIFSFHRMNPYFMTDADKGPQAEYLERVKIYTTEEMIKDATEILKGEVRPGIANWIRNTPYEVDPTSDPRQKLDKWNDVIVNAILKTDIHILIESHYLPFKNFYGDYLQYQNGDLSIQDFSPAFLTEKTYKAILCAKPVIAYSTPYFMKEWLDMGFKTFHPYIDETYDSIEDDNLRRHAICMEMGRLKAMKKTNPEQYAEVMSNCNKIALFNRNVLIQQNLDQQQDFQDVPWLKDTLIDWRPYWISHDPEDFVKDQVLQLREANYSNEPKQ